MKEEASHTGDESSAISRVRRSKADAAVSYNRLSKWYDCIASSERPFCDAALRVIDVREGEQVLEVGFGTGRALLELARRAGPGGSVAGVDISPGMADVARGRLERAGLVDTVKQMYVGDALDVLKEEFNDGQFDAAFMSFTLELFDTPEIPVLLRQLRRVLKDEGRLAVVSLSREGGGCSVTAYEYFHKMFPNVVDCRPIYAVSSLQEAGFLVQKASRGSLWGLPVDTVLAVPVKKT